MKKIKKTSGSHPRGCNRWKGADRGQGEAALASKDLDDVLDFEEQQVGRDSTTLPPLPPNRGRGYLL